MGELKELGDGDYGLGSAFQYLLLTLPRRVYELFPMALLLGGLMGMGALASSSELVVMRAAGCSILRLVSPAMQAGLVLGLVAVVLGEFLAPQTERLAQELHARAQNKAISINDGKGFWARDGNAIINVRAVLPGNTLADIYIYELGEKSDLRSLGRAQIGRFIDDQWVLEGLSRSVMHPDRVVIENIPRLAVVGSVVSPDMLEVLASDPEDLSMRDSLHYIDYLEANGLDARDHQLTYWLKVLAPLTNMTLLFVAMPFVFGPQRTARAGQRLLIAILIGLLFFLVNRMLSNWVLLYGYHPFLGASLPTLLFFAGGAYALTRVR
jgi:lipopolysaccharide export system permease protein